ELKGHMARGRVDYRQPPCRFHYWTTRDFAKGRNEIKTSVASSAKLPRQKSDTSCINLRCIASVSLLVSTSSLCRSSPDRPLRHDRRHERTVRPRMRWCRRPSG